MKRTRTFTGNHLSRMEADQLKEKVHKFCELTDKIKVLNVELNQSGMNNDISINILVTYEFINEYADMFNDYEKLGEGLSC